MDEDSIALRPPAWYEENQIELILGSPSHRARRRRQAARAGRWDRPRLREAADRHRQPGAPPARPRGMAQRPLPADPRRRPARCEPRCRPGREPGRGRSRVHRPGGGGDRPRAGRRGDHPRGAAGTARLDPRRGGRSLVRGPAPQPGRRGPAVVPPRTGAGQRQGGGVGARERAPARLRRGRRRDRGRSRGGLAGRQRARARWRADRRNGSDLDPRCLRRRRRDAVIRPAIRRPHALRALGRRRSPGRLGREGDARGRSGPPPLPSFWSDQYGLRIHTSATPSTPTTSTWSTTTTAASSGPSTRETSARSRP